MRPSDPARPVETLSGGNQQKVVIARWLEIAKKLLILEEPTAGVDVGAKAEIYALLDAALARGLAILVIATDFEEVANICHRALVFSRGRVVAEIDQRRACRSRRSSTPPRPAATSGADARGGRTHELAALDGAGADPRRAARAHRSGSASRA